MVIPEKVPEAGLAEAESAFAEPMDQRTEQEADRCGESLDSSCESADLQQAVPAAFAVSLGVYAQGSPPVLRLAANRSLLKMIFLGLITLGIYDIVILCKIPTDLNIAVSRHDGRRTMPFFAMCFVAPLTLCVLPFVWMHKLCDRIGHELRRRGLGYKFGASSFWLWNVLGTLILVGPFIFQHKLMKSMNLICEDFNRIG